MTTIEVDERAVQVGLALGLMRLADDGVAELTERGEKWLREWCEAVIAKHGEAA